MENEPRSVESPKRKRRRFQFSLRTLLLLFTVVGVWMPLLIEAATAIHDAREAARRTPCLNTMSLPWGPRFIYPPKPSPPPATQP
jgi:hypothetical protein